MKVSEIMSKEFTVVDAQMEISKIAEILSTDSERAILVLNSDETIGGIITQTDLLYKDIEPDAPLFIEFLGGIFYVQNVKTYQEELRKLLSVRARELMTTDVYTLNIEDTIEKAAKIMVEKRVGHLPVVTGNKPVGIVKKSAIVNYVKDLLTK